MDTTKHNIRIRNNIGDEIFYLDRKSSYIGIGDTTPEYKLDVDGTGRFTEELTIGEYTMPSVAGEPKQVFAADDSGNGYWADISSILECAYWQKGFPSPPYSDDDTRVIFSGCIDNYEGEFLGIARGGCGNQLWGIADSTHINLGVACTTGDSTVNQQYCTISGGLANVASGSYATVGGGHHNVASGSSAIIGGGGYNEAKCEYSTIGGGYQNTADSIYTTVSGGKENTAEGMYATVGGGEGNTASNYYAAVSGGQHNVASFIWATVSGGCNNTANRNSATVSGGFGNAASGSDAVVSGGANNTVNGVSSAIPGGGNNTVNGGFSFAFGNGVNVDSSHTAVFFKNTIPGKVGINKEYPIYNLDVNGTGHIEEHFFLSTVDSFDTATWVLTIDDSGKVNKIPIDSVGGVMDTAQFLFNKIIADDDTYTVLSPTDNIEFIAGSMCSISLDSNIITINAITGPDDDWIIDTISGTLKTILRVKDTTRGIANYDAVLFGDSAFTHVNLGFACTTGLLGSDYSFCTVSGGYINKAQGLHSTVCGGYNNQAGNDSEDDTSAFVGGGYENFALTHFTTIAGGRSNTAIGDGASICGGCYNEIGGHYSFIGGGKSNQMLTPGGHGERAHYCVIPGGQGNIIDATQNVITHSVILGGQGNIIDATHNVVTHSLVFGDSVTVDSSFVVAFFTNDYGGIYRGKVGINEPSPTAELHVNGTVKITQLLYIDPQPVPLPPGPSGESGYISVGIDAGVPKVYLWDGSAWHALAFE